ncbi:hypothetical protein ACIQU6_30760 [Streptomyces sp. NPDC090442]|uniref:hypothetical protein n=1 Tax=Streptomyces sp. NPDC090442 TaxID=3365962 RepID=UPI003830D9EC
MSNTAGQVAEQLAETACELHDTTGWEELGPAAVEDALQAIEITALALTIARPGIGTEMAAILRALHTARTRLGITPPPNGADETRDADEAQATPRRPRRRALGHGWRGINTP